MRQIAIIATLAVCACADSKPVVQNSEELQEVAQSAPEPGSNPAANETGEQPAQPQQQWFERTEGGQAWASYGPPNSEAAFSVRCEGRRLVFNTTEMPSSGPGRTQMQLSAPGVSRTLDAQATEGGLPNTEAAVPADAQWLEQLAATTGDLSVTVGGDGEPLVVPVGEPLTALIRDCRRRAASPAPA